MERRTFIKATAITATGILLNPFASCESPARANELSIVPGANGFELPALPFGFNALEPHIDAMTMEIHHGKHHAGYVKKLNAALESSSFKGMELGAVMGKITEADEAIRNNGGGHYNHTLFWKLLSTTPNQQPTEAVATAINASFGSFDGFKEDFSKAAATVFGSGWAWLCADSEGKLFVTQTPNQDNPLMTALVEKPGKPILGIDVWEHAYYLKHQNKRKDYIDAFMSIINWTQVEKNMNSTIA